MSNFIEDLNEEYFEGNLSPVVLMHLTDLNKEDHQVQSFIKRVFRLMQISKFEAFDLSPHMAWELSFIIPKTLYGAWKGIVPPITVKGRHIKIDEYILKNCLLKNSHEQILLDLGCGFPPFTTVETALKFPELNVIGADASFGQYLVHDKYDDYACFDSKKKLIYFQTGNSNIAMWDKLLKNPEKTKSYFDSLLNSLLSNTNLTPSNKFKIIEKEDARLIINPVLQYTKQNLSFVESGIGELKIDGGVDVVRCFNVLIYYDRAFREKTLLWASSIIKPGGLFICGMNWARSTHSRYTVYKKDGNKLKAKEFSFSIENLRPILIVPWVAMHDDEYETCLLAKIVSIIKSDISYFKNFGLRLDQLLKKYNVCPRQKNGYLDALEQDISPEELESRLVSISNQLEDEGFASGAVNVLKQAGYDAWVNCVGHIAINPEGIDI